MADDETKIERETVERETKDLGQRQAEDLNNADWNKREGSQADPQADTEDERREKAAGDAD